VAAVLFALAIGLAALAPKLVIEFVAIAAVGWASVMFIATGNSTLQLRSEPSMRGRVMSLWAVAFQGTTPVGGPAIGWIVAATSARIGLGVGALSCLAAAGIGLIAMAKLSMLRGSSHRKDHDPDDQEPLAQAPLGLATEED
jgi:MFS family permease